MKFICRSLWAQSRWRTHIRDDRQMVCVKFIVNWFSCSPEIWLWPLPLLTVICYVQRRAWCHLRRGNLICLCATIWHGMMSPVHSHIRRSTNRRSFPSLNSMAVGKAGRMLWDLIFPCQSGSCKSSLFQLGLQYQCGAFMASLSFHKNQQEWGNLTHFWLCEG